MCIYTLEPLTNIEAQKEQTRSQWIWKAYEDQSEESWRLKNEDHCEDWRMKINVEIEEEQEMRKMVKCLIVT